MSGTVEDQNGNVVAGAKVTFRSENNDFELTATTTGQGIFGFRALCNPA
jgi:hypothetical protein